MTDITAILVCHHPAAHPATEAAARSLHAATAFARARGLIVTTQTATATALTHAAVRNQAAAAAAGTHLAFLDPADLCCETWLHAAHAAATTISGPIVWHPEAILHHAATPPAWSLQPDAEDLRGDWVTLAAHNHWTASSFTLRDIHRQTPYPDTLWPDAAWIWNTLILAAGARHKPVEGTAHLTSHPAPTAALPPPAATLWRDRIGWAAKVGRLGRAA